VSIKIDYIPGNTLLHKAHPVTKLILSFVIFLWLFSTRNLVSVLLAFIVILIIAAYIRLPLRVMKTAFFFGLPLALLLFITQPLVYFANKTPIQSPVVPTWFPILGGAGTFYYEGLIFGLVLILRLFGILLLMPVIILTTPAVDLVIGLTQIGVPYDYAFISMMALRFLPVLSDTRERILEAQRLRALEYEKARFMTKIRRTVPLLVPLIVSAMRMGEELEVAIESRAFGRGRQRTYYRPLIYTTKQKVISLLLIIGYVLLLVYHIMYVKDPVIFPLPFEVPFFGNQIDGTPIVNCVIFLMKLFYAALDQLYAMVSTMF